MKFVSAANKIWCESKWFHKKTYSFSFHSRSQLICCSHNLPEIRPHCIKQPCDFCLPALNQNKSNLEVSLTAYTKTYNILLKHHLFMVLGFLLHPNCTSNSAGQGWSWLRTKHWTIKHMPLVTALRLTHHNITSVGSTAVAIFSKICITSDISIPCLKTKTQNFSSVRWIAIEVLELITQGLVKVLEPQ